MLKGIFSKKRKLLRAIGYWQSEEKPHYPNPLSFEDKNWDKNERQTVINYVKSGEILVGYRGNSWCRFQCGHLNMGSKDLTDGEYIWPEGFAHYLEHHNVKPPKEFIEKCKSSEVNLSDKTLDELEEVLEQNGVEHTWWISLGLKNKMNDRIIKYSTKGNFSISNFEQNKFQGITKFLKQFEDYKNKDDLELENMLSEKKEIEIRSFVGNLNMIRDEGKALNLKFGFKIKYIN